MNEQKTANYSNLQKWYLAIRPKTLPAATAPVIVGVSLALGDNRFQLLPALAALAASLLLQIGSNLANDVFDFKKGTDNEERTGPLRVTQAGLLTPREVMTGMAAVFLLAALIGLYLIYKGGWPILLAGSLAILSAITYTAGPFPLGYHGLGDIFVFIFFGPVAVVGTYYVQSQTISTSIWWGSIPMGLLITAVLVINNLRDVETDKKNGKRTTAVRFGVKATQVQYILLLLLSYLVPIFMIVMNLASSWLLLTWLSVFLAVPLIRDIFRKKGRPLNITLAGTARLSLVYALLFAMGYLL